jgi:hypothetical protein
VKLVVSKKYLLALTWTRNSQHDPPVKDIWEGPSSRKLATELAHGSLGSCLALVDVSSIFAIHGLQKNA